MTQKVLKVGSSAAVTIPKKSLKELGLKIGDQVTVRVDAKRGEVTIKQTPQTLKRAEHITKLTLDFIDRYRADLNALAKK